MKMKTLIILTALLTALLTAAAMPQTPPSEWTQFGDTACTINGQPTPVGSIVEAFDPQNVRCGDTTFGKAGLYSMAVYGDDLFSAADEGCVLGDHIMFKINGIIATENGPDSDVWEGKGPIKIMNLATIQSFSVSITGPDGTSGYLDSVVTYQVSVTNNGDGIDLIALNVTSLSGWLVTGSLPAGVYFNPAENKNFNVTVKVPSNAVIGDKDTLSVKAQSKFDPTASATKKIVTTADDYLDVNDGNFSVPGTFTLNQNFPNPFNPETMISFSLEKPADVTLAIYDILGRKVATVYQGFLPSGVHQYRWRGTDDNGMQVSSGVYFYRLSSDQARITRKMAFIK